MSANDNTSFIHSTLDDCELTPTQFRILCHVIRRGECFASTKTIALKCHLHRDSIWPALRILVSRQILKRHSRLGQTSVLTINPVENWILDPLESIEIIYADFDYPAEIESFVRYMPVNDEYDPWAHSDAENEQRLLTHWKDYLLRAQQEFG